MRDVVVFYSYSGNSRRTAGRIADARLCEVLEIRDARPRPRRFWNFWRGIFDAVKRRSPAVLPTRAIRADERVILCLPIWAGQIAAPVRTWLSAHGREIRNLAVILDSGGTSDWPKATAEIERLTGLSRFYATDIGGPDHREPRYSTRVKQILERLAHPPARAAA
jgi:hypothetical protein